MHLSAEQGQLLIKIARQQITALINNDKKIDRNSFVSDKWLFEPGAVFVTLTIDGQLRGCVGSLEAYRRLISDVIEHAGNSALHDTRFYPLTLQELEMIKIEVSVLSPRVEISYQDPAELKQIIRPGIDGVYLTLGNRGATFLPQVWEQLSDFNSFFAHLCQKAGLNPDSLFRLHPKIEIYQVQKFLE